MTKLDWENITNYIDSVGTTDTVFPFTKVQSSVKVTASGARDNIIYTIGGQSGTLTPGQSVMVTGTISSMTLRSASGKQPFQVWATEAGTEKDETDTSYQGQIDGLTTQLEEKASQTDLTTTNNTVALKADKTYVDTQVQAVASGSPKGVYATLSELQTAIPTGNSNTYVVSADGNWYYWNGSAWTSGGVYQSTRIAENAITPSKTNFAQRLTNLFNSATATTNGYYISKTTGLPVALAGYGYSDYIPVVNGGTYTFSDDNPQNFGAIYDANKNYLAGLPDGTTTNAQRSITINTPGAAFIRFNFPVPGRVAIANYIVSEGTQLQSLSTKEAISIPNFYVADNSFEGKLIKDNSLLSTKVSYINQPTSLFNKDTMTTGGFIRNNTGAFQAYAGYVCSDYIPIVNGGTYTFSDDYPSNFGAIFDGNKNYLSGLPNGNLADGSAVAPKTITINVPGAAYIRFNFLSSRVSADQYMMVSGASLPGTYTPYSGLQIPDFRLIQGNITQSILAYISSQIGGNRWIGKKGVFDGDSITDGQIIQGDTVKTTYPNLVGQILQCNISNHAKSGATISTTSNTRNIVNCVGELDSDADFVFIAGSINDFRYFPANLGDTNSIDISTFWGALNSLMQQLINKFPNIPIIFATPIHNGAENNANTFGYKLIDYVNAIRQACQKYGLICCDMYNLFGYSPTNTAVKNAVFYPDDTHPYTHVGLQEMANRVTGFLRSI